MTLAPHACLLFDLDGTLVDTDALHFAAFQETFAPFDVGLDWEAYRTRIMGAANPAIAAAFLGHVAPARHAGIMEAKEAAYRAKVGTVAPLPGLAALLARATTAGLPCGVVTNAPRANAELVLAATGLAAAFASLVIGAELVSSKPHPLPYLTGLADLHGAAEASVGFEDSRSGLTAALAAGLAVVGLATSLCEDELLAIGAHLAIRDYTDPRLPAFLAARTGLA